MLIFTLAISCLIMSSLPWFMNLTFQVPMWYCCLQHWTLLSSLNIHSWLPFPLWHSLFILSGAISNWPLPFSCSILDTFWPGGAYLLVSYLFAFSYCSWGSCSKNTGVVCHSLLQWTTFYQNCPGWPVHLAWLCMVWLMASLGYGSPLLWQSCDPWMCSNSYQI